MCEELAGACHDQVKALTVSNALKVFVTEILEEGNKYHNEGVRDGVVRAGNITTAISTEVHTE